MRSNLVANILCAFLLTIVSISAHALEVPPLKSHINDDASMLSAGTVSNLEAQLVELEKSDSTQVVVLTIPSLEGEVLEEFSIKVAEKWKIGQQKVDNGVILLISKMDRKIRIEVGRGLEGKLTDLISGRIIRDEITPKLKNGDYDGGVVAGVSAIVATVKGEYQSQYQREYKSERWNEYEIKASDVKDLDLIGFCVEVLITIFLVGLLWFVFIKKYHEFGPFFCGVAGGIIFATAHQIFFPSTNMPFLFRAVAGFIVTFGIVAAGKGGGSSSWSSSGSSFSGGSSYSGGGGSFGGGGASGSW